MIIPLYIGEIAPAKYRGRYAAAPIPLLKAKADVFKDDCIRQHERDVWTTHLLRIRSGL